MHDLGFIKSTSAIVDRLYKCTGMHWDEWINRPSIIQCGGLRTYANWPTIIDAIQMRILTVIVTDVVGGGWWEEGVVGNGWTTSSPYRRTCFYTAEYGATAYKSTDLHTTHRIKIIHCVDFLKLECIAINLCTVYFLYTLYNRPWHRTKHRTRSLCVRCSISVIFCRWNGIFFVYFFKFGSLWSAFGCALTVCPK